MMAPRRTSHGSCKRDYTNVAYFSAGGKTDDVGKQVEMDVWLEMCELHFPDEESMNNTTLSAIGNFRIGIGLTFQLSL